MALLSGPGAALAPGYRHEARLYRGVGDFVDATLPFIVDGLSAGEPVLVAVQEHKIALLRAALGADADRVGFVDLGELGRNPARIIPAWREFLSRAEPGGRVRGIGEPVWPGRTPAELVECQRHESLLNVAVSATEPFWLLCPYDVDGLADQVIDEAFRSHPFVSGGRRPAELAARGSDDACARAFLHDPLPAAPDHAVALDFDGGGLAAVRSLARSQGQRAGLGPDRVDDLELAVSEASANSVVHGGGLGRFTVWTEQLAVVCEIADRGRLADPLAGRHLPSLTADHGRGLWLVNQLCDLSQIRVFASGTVVRLHMVR